MAASPVSLASRLDKEPLSAELPLGVCGQCDRVQKSSERGGWLIGDRSDLQRVLLRPGLDLNALRACHEVGCDAVPERRSCRTLRAMRSVYIRPRIQVTVYQRWVMRSSTVAFGGHNCQLGECGGKLEGRSPMMGQLLHVNRSRPELPW